jgi:hypothetical protein
MFLSNRAEDLSDDQIKTLVRFFQMLDPKKPVEDWRHVIAHRWLIENVITVPEFVRIIDLMLPSTPEATTT